jgi:hypothetical protein
LLLNAFFGITLTIAAGWYFVWRADQPPWNPGGPLQRMPWPYLFWNWVGIFLGPWVGVRCLLNVPLYFWLRRREKRSDRQVSSDKAPT